MPIDSEYEILCDAQSFKSIYMDFFRLVGYSPGDLSEIERIFNVAEEKLGVSSRELRLMKRISTPKGRVQIGVIQRGRLVPLTRYRAKTTTPGAPTTKTAHSYGIEGADLKDIGLLSRGNKPTSRDTGEYYGSFSNKQLKEKRDAAAK